MDRYNKLFAKRLVALSQEFLEAALRAKESQGWSAYIDMLFSAFELAVKSTDITGLMTGPSSLRRHIALETILSLVRIVPVRVHERL
jgi:hypothetical protein